MCTCHLPGLCVCLRAKLLKDDAADDDLHSGQYDVSFNNNSETSAYAKQPSPGLKNEANTEET